MAKVWEPCFVNMCSFDDVEGVRRNHQFNLSVFNATEADCEMVNLVPAEPWERGVKSHWRMNVNTYKGWKVYMLATGCLASNPEYEE